ncbi:MAG: FAD:protein FMN transferase [Pseudomonadales bacterium]
MLNYRRRAVAVVPDIRHFSALLLFLVGLVPLGGCEQRDYRRYQGSTMGTYYQVTARCPGDVREPIESELAGVNAEMSTYLEDSDLSRFNQAPVGSWVAVPETLVQVVVAALELSRESAGAFDVTVGPLVNLWGFGPGGHGPRGTQAAEALPDPAQIEAMRQRVGYRFLEARAQPPALRKSADLYVDLSAIAKGHGVDRVVQRLLAAGCDAALVDVGGEVRGVGSGPGGRPWRIGIEVPDPQRYGAIERIIELRDLAVATSGDYRNFIEISGQRYSHTIDPRTGRPVSHALASVTVLHASTMWADGYATLLNVLGPEQGMAFARAHELAVLFLVRGANGFEERYTAAFEAVLADRDDP